MHSNSSQQKSTTMDVPYVHQLEVHNRRAATVVTPVVYNLFHPRSVIDVGCGLGDWLSCYQELGVQEILGVDGDYVDRSLLYIKEEYFHSHDLTKPLKLGKRYDVAQCLEVAEHLPANAAANLVKILCDASDVIVFSAAPPGQGGQNHINEQPYSYWQELFSKHSYSFYEVFSSNEIIQASPEVDIFYKQNMVLVAKNTPAFRKKFPDWKPCVHPDTMRYILIRNNELERQIDQTGITRFLILKILKFLGLHKTAKKLYQWGTKQ